MRQLNSIKFSLGTIFLGCALTPYPAGANEVVDSITILADGSTIEWHTTGPVGEATGLYITYEHTNPAQSTGLRWVHVNVNDANTSIWPSDGAGVYQIRACEWDHAAQQTTICSDYVEVTWVHDVNGIFTAIPADDPAQEAGSISLENNGAELNWQVTGDLGQASGFMLHWGEQRKWFSPASRNATWWPDNGYQPGNFELAICAYDHYRDQTGVCSNTTNVEIATNGHSHVNPVASPDAAFESGSIAAELGSDCQLQWSVSGNLGNASGFMVLADNSGSPDYGVSAHQYAAPADRSATLDHIWDSASYQANVCSYDYQRNLTGECSETVEFELSWGAHGKQCTVPVIAQAETPPANEETTPDPLPVPEVPQETPNEGGNPASLEQGLVAWRTPDANGNACASCHAPDGIDLAFPAYTREDILRRANDHVSPELSEDIADLIEAVRTDYNWTPTVDPREYRPFQPGGQPLPGDTPLQRDDAFAQQLADMGLRIATGDISSIEDALQARDELLAINLWELPVGIPFDRFSEDAAFGSEHHRFNEWVPAVGLIPNQQAAEDWYALQDLYLQNPTDESFATLLQSTNGSNSAISLNQEDQRGDLLGFETERFRSLLVLSHEQRREMAGEQARAFDEYKPHDTGALFHAGQFAYETWQCNPIHHGDTNDCMQLPMDEELTVGFFEQMEEFALSWRYAGWILNQSMEDIPGERSMLRGHYLGLNMKQEFYFVHQVFFRAMRAVRKFYGTENDWRYQRHYTPGVYPAATNAQADLLFMDQLMSQGDQGGHDLLYAPSEPQHRDRYMRFTANMYKMLLFLLQHEIESTGEVYDAPRLVEMLLGHEGAADHRWYGPVDFTLVLDEFEPHRAAENRAWLQQLANMVNNATERDPSPGFD